MPKKKRAASSLTEAGLDVLRERGIATVLALALGAALFLLGREWIIDQRKFKTEVADRISSLSDEIGHLSAIVDLSCEPEVQRGRRER